MRALILFALLASAAPALAQEVIVTGELGRSIPLGAFEEEGLGEGSVTSAGFIGRVNPVLGFYVDYAQTDFTLLEGSDFFADENWTDSGLGAGIRLYVPMPFWWWRFEPWVEGGVIFHQLSGSLVFGIEHDRATGLSAGAGLDIRVIENLRLVVPTVRYRNYSFEIEFLGDRRGFDVEYLTVGAGLSYVIEW